MPSVSTVSSGVPAVLSGPAPVRPPPICCASAGVLVRAAENFAASKAIEPSLFS